MPLINMIKEDYQSEAYTDINECSDRINRFHLISDEMRWDEQCKHGVITYSVSESR